MLFAHLLFVVDQLDSPEEIGKKQIFFLWLELFQSDLWKRFSYSLINAGLDLVTVHVIVHYFWDSV